jgi:hypothetical protein
MVGMHIALVPPSPNANTVAEVQREMAILWGRHIAPWWEAANGAQPGMTNSAAALFNAATGTYESKPVAQNPFCSGHSQLADGSVIATGGEMPSSEYAEVGQGLHRNQSPASAHMLQTDPTQLQPVLEHCRPARAGARELPR